MDDTEHECKQSDHMSFNIHCLEENSDGSLNIEIEGLSEKMKGILIGEGLNFLFLKMILDGNTDQVLNWAQRGKQEENTDRLVEKFNEIYSEDTK